MLLRFVAKADLLVTVPGQSVRTGQALRYVGRQYTPPGDGVGASYPATEEPFAVEFGSAEGMRLAKLCRRDKSLYPFDAETAAACGVQYVPVQFSAGEWSPAPPAPTASRNKGRA